jgi:hypothetical protein
MNYLQLYNKYLALHLYVRKNSPNEFEALS